MAKNYWICVIEVDSDLPDGAFDHIPRLAAVTAIEKFKVKVKSCWSSWGVSKSMLKKIMDIWYEYE